MTNRPLITTISGGTGGVRVAEGLGAYKQQIDLACITTMADSGGSSGVLKDEYGILPPGDILKLLVATSQNPKAIRDLLVHRYDSGLLKNHSLGNIIITAVEKEIGRKGVVKMLSDWWDCWAKIIPVTYDDVSIRATTKRGRVIDHEDQIDRVMNDDILDFIEYIDRPSVNSDAIESIINSELIVIAPGDLFTSNLPVLIIPEIQQAMRNSDGKVVLITPLMNKFGHTNDFEVLHYIQAYEKVLGSGSIDIVMCNTGKPHQDVMDRYAQEGQLVTNITPLPVHIRVIANDYIIKHPFEKVKGDPVDRSIVRHDSVRLCSDLYDLLQQNRPA
ncbi:YvcK family protein [Candidatus Falkowbacteria bacterium]|nr:YvcK family protein [Candidatus Falkowbacteria bacterium]